MPWVECPGGGEPMHMYAFEGHSCENRPALVPIGWETYVGRDVPIL